MGWGSVSVMQGGVGCWGGNGFSEQGIVVGYFEKTMVTIKGVSVLTIYSSTISN